jgi:hypothetical protein
LPTVQTHSNSFALSEIYATFITHFILIQTLKRDKLCNSLQWNRWEEHDQKITAVLKVLSTSEYLVFSSNSFINPNFYMFMNTLNEKTRSFSKALKNLKCYSLKWNDCEQHDQKIRAGFKVRNIRNLVYNLYNLTMLISSTNEQGFNFNEIYFVILLNEINASYMIKASLKAGDFRKLNSLVL